MGRAALLGLLLLGGCDLLLPLGSSARRDAPRPGDTWSQDAPKLDVRPPDGAGWIQVYNLGDVLPGCPKATPRELVPEPTVGGCKIKGPLGCEKSGGNFAGWTIAPKLPYRHVLGFASGHQWKSTDGFKVQNEDPTLDDAYVEGVSITHGSPRQHIWTYASGLSRSGGNSCPCWGGRRPPAFVGESYTCDSGNYAKNGYDSIWYPAPLWDGDSAGVVGPSADLGPGGCKPPENPGWFQVQLPQETSDPIEVRVLFDSCDENIALTALKLWVHADSVPSDLGARDLLAPDLDATPVSDLDAGPVDHGVE